MDKPISVGDLVALIRACCDSIREGRINRFGIVEAMASPHDFECQHCGFTTSETLARVPDISKIPNNKRSGHFPLSWLKRIPPLSELEGEKREEEITA